MNKFVAKFEQLTQDLDTAGSRAPRDRPFLRTWSYGDVENNGIYYHPQLTHYAHQAFEEFFFAKTGLHYVDLSRQTERSKNAHVPAIPRMTFPVEWLYQWMVRPMEAGDQFHIGLDVVNLTPDRVGIRAWVFDDPGRLVAVVIWLRAAVELEGGRRTVDFPSWFPRS
jgi:acyl-CoA thioesterase FadM